MESQRHILAINGGSSSLKFALFNADDPTQKIFSGKVDASAATAQIFDQLRSNSIEANIVAIGHRIVFGSMNYGAHTVIDDALLTTLHENETFNPDHLPGEIKLIDECTIHFPDVPQIACFDTAFFHDLPRVAQILPIPRKYFEQGIRRYGFHGLSYEYLMKDLATRHGESVANGRVIFAHLGSGASLAAVKGGTPIDTTMSFTPTSGVPMSTRSGDLDPGLVNYLAQRENMTAEQFNDMVNHHAGSLGVSDVSDDMYYLLEHMFEDERCMDAVTLFCYEVKKRIGAFAAAMGGVDTVVFAGGIGEKAPRIRKRVCEGLEFLGIELDHDRDERNESVLSPEGASVLITAVYTDEESIVASAVHRIITSHT